jgi:hypothetical protein
LIINSTEFIFRPPSVLSRARRVLIKPTAAYPTLYPVTTSRRMLKTLIEGIRRISDADIIILEGTPDGSPVRPIYQKLEYDFPRVLMLDVKDCILVEVDNPLPKPLAVPTFWVPNVILSSDYLISVAPLKILGNQARLSIMNLLSLLPSSKYASGDGTGDWSGLYSLGIEKVIADLYFTLPFDMGIVEARQKFTSRDGFTEGEAEDYGKIFVGEPYEVDSEVSQALGIKVDYLDLIKEARVGFEV